MKRFSLPSALLTALLSVSTITAQETEPPPELTAEEKAEAQEKAQAAADFTVPAEVATAIEVDVAEMRETLAVATPDKLSQLLDEWMALVQTQQSVVDEALAAPEGSDARAQADALGTDRDALIARAEAVIELLVEKGGDVEAARSMISDIREEEVEQAQEISTVPEDQAMAQKVNLEVLKAQLRPLRVDDVAEQAELWMQLLKKKCLEVQKAEVAGLRAETDEDIDKFSAAASSLRIERDALIKRTRAVIDALEEKAGDEAKVTELRAYISSIVVTPPATGIRAAWTGFITWLRNPDGGIALGLNLGIFVLTLLGFRILAGIISRLLGRALRALKRTPELLQDFFVNSARKVVMLIGLFFALDNLGVSMTPLVAAIGGAAFVIGFALQGTLSNFASGIMLLMYRPYNVGDVVEFGGGTMGKVAGQNLVSTTVKTFDNKVVMIPNNKIWGDVITNATASDQRRVDMVFGIGYGDDIARSEEVLKTIVGEHDKVLSHPEPVIQVHELGDSSVNFVVRPWVQTADYWNVYWDITRAVKERFDAEGITIPFPQRDVHVHQEAAPKAEDVVLMPRPTPPAPVERQPVVTGDLGVAEGGSEAAETEESTS